MLLSHTRLLLVGLIFVALLVGAACSGETKHRSDYGSRWPFTVDSVTLHCAGSEGFGAVWVETGGYKYALNGVAETRFDYILPLERIWRNNPNLPGTKISIGPMINEGLALC